MNSNIEPVLLEIDDLCRYLGIGKNTAYNLLNSGEIDGFKLGGSVWKVPKKSVDEYIERKCNQNSNKHMKVMCRIVKK